MSQSQHEPKGHTIATTRVVGYVRVSTDEQERSGAGIEAQRAAITAEAERRGWRLVGIEQDTASGKSTKRRPGLAAALEQLDGGKADSLMVAKLDRLSRSLLDFAALVEQSRRNGWSLVALDLGVDTTTPSGEMMANVLAVFAQFERRLIGQRTKDGLAAGRAAGTLRGPIGRPRQLSDEVVRRIRAERAVGWSTPKIAAGLNADGVPTAQGGARWYPSTVSKVLQSAAAVVV